MGKVKIYMISPDKPMSAEYLFLSRKTIVPALYNQVFQADKPFRLSDNLFSPSLQLQKPRYTNLSVSDIVVFEDDIGKKEGFILKDNGWLKLSTKILKEIESNQK